MPLSDEQRFPLLDERGAQNLKWLREHPHAPSWNYTCGDMLSRDDLAQVREFEAQISQKNIGWNRGQIPDWLKDYADFCLREVPFYRARISRERISSTRSEDFFDLPTVSRRELAREVWSFVPDNEPLDELVMYWTSGTTSEPLPILSHPRTTSMYLPLLQKALSLHGVSTENKENRVAIALVCAQKKTLTYYSVSSVFDNAGFVKINLNRDDWRDENDAMKFLESCAPQVITGDPVSFAELMRLQSSTRCALQPRALVSSATTLLPALKTQLETHFGCPILDLYSSNEAGIVAVACDEGFEILPSDLYIETAREDGSICDENEIGEIVVSGGRNPFLPLLRYRTGDFGSLQFRENQTPLLRDFSGRAPVLFRNAKGEVLTSIDVANALRSFALSHFAIHQNADRSLMLRVPQTSNDFELRRALKTLFGDLLLSVEEFANFDEISKTIYSSDLTM